MFDRVFPARRRAQLLIILLAFVVVYACSGRVAGPPSMLREMTLGEKPDDHNIWFRRHHGESATSNDAKCGYCHMSTSGSPVDSCADCHATVRPRDHRLRFRGVEHGRAAAREPERCATCHEAEVCASCHAIPPPSHSPLRVFLGRHATLAGKDPRACLTCHNFETTCVRCHALDITPR